AKRQPLMVVLYKVANETGIPFDLRHETIEIIDADFKNYTLERAVRALSPVVRLHYRLDLQTSETVPLRLALSSSTRGPDPTPVQTKRWPPLN
ncbi:MAG: hypothetical protein ACRD68_16535, partial [Pyrinomonadaceae bacterium]